MNKLLLTLLTPAVIGGSVGFAANQLADYRKEEKKNDTTLRFENMKEARAIVNEYVDQIAKSPIKLSTDADPHIASLVKKRRSLDNDDARAKLTVEISELELIRERLFKLETEASITARKIAEADKAKREGDAEATRKAQQEASDQAERLRKEQEKTQLAAQRFEERIFKARAN